jgi:hypothetical protein
MITVKVFQRLERWNRSAYAPSAGGWPGPGTRQGVWPRSALFALTVRHALTGDHLLTAQLDARHADSAALARGQVLRVQDADPALADEYEVIDLDLDATGGMLTVTALGCDAWMARIFPFYEDAQGRARLVYTYENRPVEHLINDACFIAGSYHGSALNFGLANPVVPVPARVNATVSWESMQAFLLRTVPPTGNEMEVVRNGITGPTYGIQLVAQRGAGAGTLDIRAGKNLSSLRVRQTSPEYANRVIPKGAADSALDAAAATLAQATWKVGTVTDVPGSGGGGLDHAWVQLLDPAGGPGPIAYDGQWSGTARGFNIVFALLNGVVRNNVVGGITVGAHNLSSILDSRAATQEVLLAGCAGWQATGDVGRIAPFAGGSTLLDFISVDHMPAQAPAGVQPIILECPDVPPYANWVPNPAMRVWTGGVGGPPDGWAVVGGATLTKDLVHVQNSPQSTRVQGVNDGDGIRTANLTPLVSDIQRYVSGYARLWVAAGMARVELVFTTPGGTVVVPAAAPFAVPSKTGMWVEVGVQGIDTYWAQNATAVTLRVVQHGATALDCYVQAAQLTTSAAQQAFTEGGGPNALWQRANAELLKRVAVTVEGTVTLADLHRVRGAVGPDAVQLGQSVRITHPLLATPLTTRVAEVLLDYLTPGNTQIVPAAQPAQLSALIASPAATRAALGTAATTPGTLRPL